MTIGRTAAAGARSGVPGAAPGTRRVFIAVPLPPGLRDEVGGIVDRARTRAEAGSDAPGRPPRWVHPDSLHLTLRFLGDTPDRRLTDLRAALDAAGEASTPFVATLQGSGAFPGASAPRALWLGVRRGGDELAALAAAVDAELALRGWPSDGRPFRAHLTIGRCEDPARGRDALRALEAEARPLAASWLVDRIVLFESHLGHGPARYEVVADAPLGR
jgi:RNA 2',3'-cyclic 3'-phosphodiesterase